MADADESEIEIPQELREVADKLGRGEALPPITVRELLRYFSARRRGFYIVLRIQEVLESLALRTEPDFRDLWIDGEIKLVKASTAESAGAESGAEPGGNSAAAASDSGGAGAGQCPPNGSPPEPDRPLGPDPTLRVETLDAANRGVLSVKPDEPISLAITRMLVNNYSQLPVMPNPRTAKGIVSWATIGPGISMNNQGAAVRHHMQKASIVDYDDTFLDVLPTIIDKGYVLVRGRDASITGIVTASDVSVEFQKRAEPFLLLSEIEQHIRNIIEGKLSTEELRSVKNPADTSRTVNVVSDLTFFEHILIFQNPVYWPKINLEGIHKNEFVGQLEKIAVIRNEVMHISPDPLDSDQLQTLQTGAKFFQQLQNFRAEET